MSVKHDMKPRCSCFGQTWILCFSFTCRNVCGDTMCSGLICKQLADEEPFNDTRIRAMWSSKSVWHPSISRKCGPLTRNGTRRPFDKLTPNAHFNVMVPAFYASVYSIFIIKSLATLWCACGFCGKVGLAHRLNPILTF